MKRLTREQVLFLHRELINAHGGSDGLRDEGLLDSALAAPFQTFDGQPMLPTIQASFDELLSWVLDHES